MVHGWIQSAVRMRLVTDIASHAVGHNGGAFCLQLRWQLKTAEVPPESLDAGGQALRGHLEAARIANYRGEIVVAIPNHIREGRLEVAEIHKCSTIGKAVRPFILRVNQTSGARFLYHSMYALEE